MTRDDAIPLKIVAPNHHDTKPRLNMVYEGDFGPACQWKALLMKKFQYHYVASHLYREKIKYSLGSENVCGKIFSWVLDAVNVFGKLDILNFPLQ